MNSTEQKIETLRQEIRAIESAAFGWGRPLNAGQRNRVAFLEQRIVELSAK
jgi:hypothetical protein